MANLILEIATGGLNLYHSIDKPETTIGRAPDNDIILSDPTVAPHHARIVSDAEGVEIVNLSNVNPVRVNRRPIDAQRLSTLPLTLELGRVKARLRANTEGAAARGVCGVPTVELTVHFRECLPLPRATSEDFALAIFRTRLAREGFMDEEGEIP